MQAAKIFLPGRFFALIYIPQQQAIIPIGLKIGLLCLTKLMQTVIRVGNQMWQRERPFCLVSELKLLVDRGLQNTNTGEIPEFLNIIKAIADDKMIVNFKANVPYIFYLQ